MQNPNACSTRDELANPSRIQALRVVIRALNPGSDIRIEGPPGSATASTDFLEQLRDFWDGAYRKQMPYLLNEEQRRLEWRLQIEGRSTHVVLMQEERIAATLRVTPAPFELSELTPELAQVAHPFTGFAEFSRLICDSSVRGTLLGTQLMGEACLWALEQGFEGIVAICKAAPRQLFERYGLRPYADREFLVPTRNNGTYFLMTGRWTEIIESALHHLTRRMPSQRLATLAAPGKGDDRC